MLVSNDENLAFQYADPEGQWHEHWPIARDSPPTRRERVPRMIRLVSPQGRMVWLAHVDLFPEPIPNYREKP